MRNGYIGARGMTKNYSRADLDFKTEFSKGIWKENPVFIAVLGMCPVLAVTNSAINGIAMGLATFFVLFSTILIMGTATVIWILLGNN